MTDKIHSSAHHHRSKKIIKHTYVVIATGAAILIGLLVTYFIAIHILNAKKTDTAKNEIVGVGQQVKKVRTVSSQLGFAVTYSPDDLSATGQVTDGSSTPSRVTGQEFDGADLETSRPYGLIHIDYPKSDTSTLASNQSLTLLTSIRKDYFTSRLSLPENKMKSEIDLWVDDIISQKSADGETPGQPSDVNINNVAYKKITFTHANDSYGIKVIHTTTMYVTVQNHRPYYAEISNQTDANKNQTAELESVIKTVTFTSFDQTKLSKASLDMTLAKTASAQQSSSDLSLPSDGANVPTPLDPKTVAQVVVKNQIAVVRVATLYCNDLTLRSGAATLALKDACSGGIGSGSIVSRDGYIATNGHVAVVTPKDTIQGYINLVSDTDIQQQHIEDVVRFLVTSGKMSQTQGNALIRDVSVGSSDAVAAVQQLPSLIANSEVTSANQATRYAIQLGNTPIEMKANGANRVGLNYSSTVVPAKFIGADYNAETADQDLATGNFTTSDVAILKIDGNYPSVQLGSMDNVADGDELTAIGFPAFVDNGLNTTKLRTVPSVTQGIVLSISTDNGQVSGRKILQTNVPIGHGNSGGPAFSTDGKQIGLNTYSAITCPDQKCFGDGTIRDIADYKSLLSEKNISLNTDSDITKQWDTAIDDYLAGNYKQALSGFKSSAKQYPSNYLASSLITLTGKHIGASDDTSSNYDFVSTIAVAIIIVIIAIAFSTGFVIFMVLRTKKIHGSAVQIVPVSDIQVNTIPEQVAPEFESQVTLPKSPQTSLSPPEKSSEFEPPKTPLS
ncbi:MAG: serine protease [Candidatus Saccharimonadales bacterium]